MACLSYTLGVPRPKCLIGLGDTALAVPVPDTGFPVKGGKINVGEMRQDGEVRRTHGKIVIVRYNEIDSNDMRAIANLTIHADSREYKEHVENCKAWSEDY